MAIHPIWTKVRPDAFGVKRCQNEIRSGRYQSIVVLDYSNPDLVKKFERDFGKLLQNFARAGGAVAFPSSEGLIISTLQNYFDVEWKFSDYYRTNWGPCLEDNEINIHRNFGNGTLSKSVIKGYSAKGCSFRVPKHERCFGVTDESTTQSLVPFMAGRDKSKQEGEDDYDVVVAVHDFGKGVIAYFGDVNAECRGSNDCPSCCFCRISCTQFANRKRYGFGTTRRRGCIPGFDWRGSSQWDEG